MSDKIFANGAGWAAVGLSIALARAPTWGGGPSIAEPVAQRGNDVPFLVIEVTGVIGSPVTSLGTVTVVTSCPPDPCVA